MISMAATPIFHGRHDKYEHGEKRFKLEVAHEAKKGLRNSSALLSYGARRTVHPPVAAAAARCRTARRRAAARRRRSRSRPSSRRRRRGSGACSAPTA